MSRERALRVLSGEIPDEEPYTAARFEADLGDARGEAAERRAAELTGEVAAAEPRHVPVIKSLLQGRDVRARWLRDWYGDVRAQRKFELASGPEQEAEDAPPLGKLKGGALHAALGERLRDECEAFAADPGDALYRYDARRGYFRGPCETWVRKRVRAVLHAEGALDLFSERKVKAVVYDLLTTAERLDSEPPRNRLCLENGVLDLDTGRLWPHGPERWQSTYGLPITFDPDADPTAPTWAAYFDGVLPADAGAGWGFALVRWLMTPASGKRPAVLLYGPGDDGKSTFLRLLRTVLGGDDGASVAAASLQALTSDRFAPADLFGAMLNVCADLPNEPLPAAAVGRFKEVTGGDVIRAERKYGDPFAFAPFAHLVFSTNHPIQVKGADDAAFWSRWLAVPFDGARLQKRAEVEIRSELLAPRALSDLLAAALSCGDADGHPPTPTPSMEACLASMRVGAGTRPGRPPLGEMGDGTAGTPPPAVPTDNFPNAEEDGHTPPVSKTGSARKVVGPEADPAPGSGLDAPEW